MFPVICDIIWIYLKYSRSSTIVKEISENCLSQKTRKIDTLLSYILSYYAGHLIINRAIELLDERVKVETLQSEIATEVSFILRTRWYCRHVAHAIHFRKHISIFPLHTENIYRPYPHNPFL